MNNNYDRYLSTEITTLSILLCILVPISLVITCFGIRYFKSLKKADAATCFVISAIVFVTCIFLCLDLVPYVSDLKNQAYIKYEGEFYVEDGEYDLRTGSKPLVGFSSGEEKKRYKVRDNTHLQDGHHQGYIVYSEQSKVIVEWYCNDCG